MKDLEKTRDQIRNKISEKNDSLSFKAKQNNAHAGKMGKIGVV